jgi:hypothetical protein
MQVYTPPSLPWIIVLFYIEFSILCFSCFLKLNTDVDTLNSDTLFSPGFHFFIFLFYFLGDFSTLCSLLFFFSLSNLLARCLWLMPVIIATQETQIRRIMVRSQPGQIVCETLSWWSCSRWRPWVQAPVPQKKKKKFKDHIFNLSEPLFSFFLFICLLLFLFPYCCFPYMCISFRSLRLLVKSIYKI